MNNSLEPGDWGAVLAIGAAFVSSVAAIPLLSAEFIILFALDGTPSSVVTTVPGVFIVPVFTSALFLYLRSGQLLSDRVSRAGSLSTFFTVTGTALLQGSLLLLNLDILSNPLLAVAPGILIIVVGGLLQPRVPEIGSR